MQFISKNPQQTEEFAQKFAQDLEGGEILAFVGNLGAGKTTFVQAIGKHFGIDRIISPTFILMRKYTLPKTQNLYHIDLYRLESNLKDEITNLGLLELWGKKENIVVIEWADKIKDLLPKTTTWITLEALSENERKITIT